MSEVKPNKKQKRVLNRWFLCLLSIVLILLISIFKIPDFIRVRNLEDLGYDTEAISAIKTRRLTNTILENSYYSDYLNAEVKKENFKEDHLVLYAYVDDLSEDDFLLFDKLILKGYTENETVNLFRELEFFEVVPLLVFDKLDNPANYISDCISNRATNSTSSLILSNDYLKAYNNTQEAKGIGTSTVLVSKKFTLGEYVPEKLVPLTVQYASDGVELENECYGAFIKMCDDMRSQGLSIYALSGYRSYTSQNEIYNSYSSSDDADSNTTRPGYSEAQTGLSVTIVDSANESLSNFVNTSEYAFIKDHGHEYGFIIRYPENKSSITGYSFTPYQIRYVGIDVATALHDSGMCYEEYYLLYLD